MTRSAGARIQPDVVQQNRDRTRRIRGRSSDGSAQHGVNPRGELARIEWFWEIVVGADFQSHNAVDIVTVRGEHDDGDRGLGPDAAQNFKPANTGQHDVEDDQRIGAGNRALQAQRTVVDGLDLEALGFQILPDEFTKLYVIIDDQYAHGGQSVRAIGLGRPHYITLYSAPAGSESRAAPSRAGAVEVPSSSQPTSRASQKRAF